MVDDVVSCKASTFEFYRILRGMKLAYKIMRCFFHIWSDHINRPQKSPVVPSFHPLYDIICSGQVQYGGVQHKKVHLLQQYDTTKNEHIHSERPYFTIISYIGINF